MPFSCPTRQQQQWQWRLPLFFISAFFDSINLGAIPCEVSCASNMRSHSSCMKLRAFVLPRKPVMLICIGLAIWMLTETIGCQLWSSEANQGVVPLVTHLVSFQLAEYVLDEHVVFHGHVRVESLGDERFHDFQFDLLHVDLVKRWTLMVKRLSSHRSELRTYLLVDVLGEVHCLHQLLVFVREAAVLLSGRSLFWRPKQNSDRQNKMAPLGL